MFSRRTGWNRAPNAFSAALAEARFNPRFIDLTTSNPTRAGIAPIDVRLPTSPEYEPNALGSMTARAAVCDYYRRRGDHVDPSRVMLVASTSEAYAHLFRLLVDPGASVLVPKPSYPLFDYLTELADVTPVEYRWAYDGTWHLPAAAFEGASARAILVVSPNNPTGTVPDDAERARINALAVPVIADEVFSDYADRRASWIDNDILTFSLNGLSKAAALPQMKLSWIVASGPPDQVEEAMARLEIIGDTFLSVATPIQHALPEILDRADDLQHRLTDRIRTNRDTLARSCRDTAVSVRPSHGGWTAMIDVPRVRTDEAWALLLLRERQVAVHPGYLFDADDALVLSTIVEPSKFEAGVRRILSAVH